MINLHIVRNTVRNDSRVLKEAGTLAASGLFEGVEIVGLNEPGLPEQETIAGLPVRRISLSSRRWSKGLPSQALKYAEWHVRILRLYAGRRIGVVHCHDIDPLPIGLHLRARTGARVIYDAHELETEQGWSSRARTIVYRALERRMTPRVDAMLTVSGGIARWYRDSYGIPLPELVRNVPERPAERPVPVDWRGALGVPGDALLFLFLGALAPQRGIEQLLAAFAAPGVRHHLLCIGYGPLADAVRAAGAACTRIHCRDAVPPSEVLRHAAGADVGVTMTMDTCLSHHWSLPNKLFEAMMAGLPVLVSDLPEIRAVVEAHDAGWITRVEVAAIAERLRGIDVAEHRRVRAGLAERTARLGWHQEAAVLLGAYRRVLGVAAPTGS